MRQAGWRAGLDRRHFFAELAEVHQDLAQAGIRPTRTTVKPHAITNIGSATPPPAEHQHQGPTGRVFFYFRAGRVGFLQKSSSTGTLSSGNMRKATHFRASVQATSCSLMHHHQLTSLPIGYTHKEQLYILSHLVSQVKSGQLASGTERKLLRLFLITFLKK